MPNGISSLYNATAPILEHLLRSLLSNLDFIMEDFEAFADASTAKGAADATHGFICIAVDKTGKHISHHSAFCSTPSTVMVVYDHTFAFLMFHSPH